MSLWKDVIIMVNIVLVSGTITEFTDKNRQSFKLKVNEKSTVSVTSKTNSHFDEGDFVLVQGELNNQEINCSRITLLNNKKFIVPSKVTPISQEDLIKAYNEAFDESVKTKPKGKKKVSAERIKRYFNFL